MSKMKDSGISWIGTIPADWSIERLKNLGTTRSGISSLKPEDFGVGSPFLTYKNVYKNYEIDYNAEDLVNSTEIDKEKYSIKKGDAFFTGSSETIEELGLSAVATQDWKNAVFNGFTIRFRPNNFDRYHTKYMKYLFRSEVSRGYLSSNDNSITRANLGQDKLRCMPIVIPPLPIQVTIANYLDDKCGKIDALIANEEATILELKEYKKSLIQKVTTKNDHWETKPLRAFLKRTSSKGRPDLPLLSVERDKGVVDRKTEGSPDNWNVIPEDLSGYKVVEKGDFVMNKMKAWQGSFGVSRHKGIVSPAYYTFSLSFDNKEFFNLAIRSQNYINVFAKHSFGIRVDQWDFDIREMKNISFHYPDPKEQHEIVEFIKNRFLLIERLISLKQQKIAELKEYKKSLIYECVTGKKEVV